MTNSRMALASRHCCSPCQAIAPALAVPQSAIAISRRTQIEMLPVNKVNNHTLCQRLRSGGKFSSNSTGQRRRAHVVWYARPCSMLTSVIRRCVEVCRRRRKFARRDQQSCKMTRSKTGQLWPRLRLAASSCCSPESSPSQRGAWQAADARRAFC